MVGHKRLRVNPGVHVLLMLGLLGFGTAWARSPSQIGGKRVALMIGNDAHL
jgi:hypothetical protein